MLASTIANYKRGEMQALEENGNRAMAYVDAFINGVDWKRSVEELDRLSKVTKADVVAWANEKLDPEVYAAVYTLAVSRSMAGWRKAIGGVPASGKRSDRPLKWVRLIFLLSPACRLPIRWTAARGGWKRG